jgi:hypothetical protein
LDSCEETSTPHCRETKTICRNAERPPFRAAPDEPISLSEGEAPTPVHPAVNFLLSGLEVRVLDNELNKLNRPTERAIDADLVNLIRYLNDGAVRDADL